MGGKHTLQVSALIKISRTTTGGTNRKKTERMKEVKESPEEGSSLKHSRGAISGFFDLGRTNQVALEPFH